MYVYSKHHKISESLQDNDVTIIIMGVIKENKLQEILFGEKGKREKIKWNMKKIEVKADTDEWRKSDTGRWRRKSSRGDREL